MKFTEHLFLASVIALCVICAVLVHLTISAYALERRMENDVKALEKRAREAEGTRVYL